MKKVAAALSGAVLVMSLSACGTILHPERKGQVDGRLDPAIVALNAVGLLFFLIPGVIAFAVDFSNGTIYLPDGSASVLDPSEQELIVRDGQVDLDALQALLREKEGLDIDLSEHVLQVSSLSSGQSLVAMARSH